MNRNKNEIVVRDSSMDGAKQYASVFYHSESLTFESVESDEPEEWIKADGAYFLDDMV